MRKQQLQKGIASELRIEAPTRPSAAAVTLYSVAGVPLLTATAVVDAANTTIASWSASDPRKVVLDATIGIAADRNFAITLRGQVQAVRVTQFDLATKTVWLQDDPVFDLAAGAAFQSRTVRYSVPATTFPECGRNLRAFWALTIGNSAEVHEQMFDVVLSAPRNPATAAGLRRYKPEVTSTWDQVSSSHTWDDAIATAFERVCLDLEQQTSDNIGDMLYAVVDWDQLEPVIYERVLLDRDDVMIPARWKDQPADYHSKRVQEYVAAIKAFRANIRYLDPAQNRTGGAEKRRFAMLVP